MPGIASRGISAWVHGNIAKMDGSWYTIGSTSDVNKQHVEVIHWSIPRCKTSDKTVDVCTAIDCSLGPCLDGRISIPGKLASI